MTKTPIWKSIHEALAAEIAQGLYTAGDKLPTEAALSARFGVNRHTVRHALSAMADSGLVRARRGAGVFVTSTPTDYPLGKRVRFHQTILASGRLPTKQKLRLEVRPSTPREASALDIDNGADLLIYEGLSLAGADPIALFQSVFPLARLTGIKDAFEHTLSVTEALAAVGVTDYTRAETRITAHCATTVQALHLNLKEGDALLRTTALNIAPDGTHVEFGTTWFAGDRVTLTVGAADGSPPAEDA